MFRDEMAEQLQQAAGWALMYTEVWLTQQKLSLAQGVALPNLVCEPAQPGRLSPLLKKDGWLANIATTAVEN